jgi:hypothetical protein
LFERGEGRTSAERTGGRAEEVERQRCVCVAVQDGEPEGRLLAVRGEIGQPLLLGGQPAVLVGVTQIGGVELTHLVREDVQLPGTLELVTAEGSELTGEGRKPATERVHPVGVDGAEAVECPSLGAGMRQLLVVTLTVDVDEHCSRLEERSDRSHLAVDPAPRPPGDGDGAGDHGLGPRLVEETGLHQGLVGSGPNQRGIGPLSEHELEGFDQQGLSGPRLSGERGHPRLELDRQVFDDPEVADAELGQHGLSDRVRRPGCSAAGSRTPGARA